MFGISFWTEKPFQQDPIEKNSKVEPIEKVSRGHNNKEGRQDDPREERSRIERELGLGNNIDIDA